MVISAQRQEWEVWSRRFIRELNACVDVKEWAELIAGNGDNLGHCSEHNPVAYVTVKVAIDEKQKEFPRWDGNTLSASSNPETSASTPTTTTETPSK